MATPYDAVAHGDFTDPETRLSWFQAEARRVAAMTDRQIKAAIRLAMAELVDRQIEIRDDRSATGLAMALMFACGFLTAVPLTLALYLVVIS